MNEGPEYIANELRNPAWKDHCIPAAVELMLQAAAALRALEPERCLKLERIAEGYRGLCNPMAMSEESFKRLCVLDEQLGAVRRARG